MNKGIHRPEIKGVELQRGWLESCLLSWDNGKSTTMPKTAESAFNSELAKVPRRKHLRWPDRIGSAGPELIMERLG